ncbi:LysM peptidoglycan-binding domain-containing protein [Thermodesulfobacteriota bacterium]
MKKEIKNRYIIVVLIFAIGCFFLNPSVIWAQKLTHTVQKGDTLWSICEKYYGDSDLWPKLWQMNPFVTNPHLLNPGDVIVLFEKEPVKEVKIPVIVEKKPPVKKEKPEPKIMGINLFDLTEINTIGYFAHGNVKQWGALFASESGRILFTKDDFAFVLFDENRDIKVGDEFFIGRSSPPVKHPDTRKKLGHVFAVNGRMVVEERLGLAYTDRKFYDKKNVFKVKVTEVYNPVRVEDIVVPYQSVSGCVLPIPINKKLLLRIIASKNQLTLIHKNSIVYIDQGFNHGINRGNVFEVVKPHITRDPKPGKKDYPFEESRIILPDKPVGRIMVLESRPDTSTAIVLSATEPFSVGVYIKDISWVETTDFLSSIAQCPIE